MRCLGYLVLGFTLAGSASGQTMTEFGAAAAAGSVGGAAGKKVSEGVTAIFGKLDQQTKAASKEATAKEDSSKPEVTAASSSAGSSSAGSSAAVSGSSSAPAAPSSVPALSSKPVPATKAAKIPVVRRESTPSVPDPPASATHPAAVNRIPEPAPHPQPVVEVAAVIPPPPPPPEVTAENLKAIAPGATREDVLKLGAPSSRMTMFGDEGHLLEIYSYTTKGATFGVVRLSDGSVSKIELR